MTDPISKLRGLCRESKGRDEELRAGFAQLERTLVAATAGVDAFGASRSCHLATYGDGEVIYGHLSFNGSALRVAHRSTEDDLQPFPDGDPNQFPFSLTPASDCRAVWLRALAAPAIVESLVGSITEAVQASLGDATDGVRVLAATINLPVRDLESALVDVAERLDYQVVLEDWRRAQSALGVGPPNAASLANRLLESLL